MKKRILTVAVICTLGLSMVTTSCIGSFSLTNKLLDWNRSIGGKFVNELVFCVFWFLPVYEVAGLADVLVLNSIEFWSGKNPVTSSTRTVEGRDGKYLVKSDERGYDITNLTTGDSMRLNYQADTNSWWVCTANGQSEFLRFVDETHVSVPTTDGQWQVVEISENGVLAYQQTMTGIMLAAR